MKLYNNKKGVRFESILIGFIVFALVLTGGILILSDLNSNYGFDGVNISVEEYTGLNESASDIFRITDSADDKVFHGDTTEGTAEDATIGGAYSTIRLITGSYALFQNVTTIVGNEVGVSPILIKAAFTAFTLIIIFSAVYLIFRFIPK